MKLIVGLGNKTKEYENTRHNIGFFFIDNYLQKEGLSLTKTKFNGLYGDFLINGCKVIFVKPLSFMNLSGTVIKPFVDYYKINSDDILIIQDDLDLSFGKIKLKKNSSSGGHNGIQNIIDNLQRKDFLRIKVGIGRNININMCDYVLGKFDTKEQTILEEKVPIVNRIINDFISEVPIDKMMSQYNGDIHGNI